MLEYMLGFAKSIDWKAAAGVLFGACISAVVSFVLQRSSFKEARQQKEKDRRDLRKAYALSLVFKMIRISSDLNGEIHEATRHRDVELLGTSAQAAISPIIVT